MFKLIEKFNQIARNLKQAPVLRKAKQISIEDIRKLRDEIESRVNVYIYRNDDIDRQIRKLERQRSLNNKAIQIGNEAIKKFDDGVKSLTKPKAKPSRPKK
jgi:hypothetical protein